MKQIFCVLLLSILYITAFSQNTCPRHMIDCHGICGRFIDTDGDGFCDLGAVSKKDEKKDSVLVKIENTDTVKKISIVDTQPQKNKKVEVSQNITKIPTTTTSKNTKNINIDTVIQQNPQIIDTHPKKNTITVVENKTNKPIAKTTQSKARRYNLISISLATFFFYFLTLFLSKKQILTKRTHRQIWNVLLLLTFLVSGLFGLFLVIQINYDFVLDWFRTVLYWHVQFGIAMSLIAIFHFLWHLKYYFNIFKKNVKDKEC